MVSIFKNSDERISTHAPLARCDRVGIPSANTDKNFNSRTSCEVRPGWTKFPAELVDFNSRTSCEVRRGLDKARDPRILISTHAPLARCDGVRQIYNIGRKNFNSRTSCEVRLHTMKKWSLKKPISTHAPLARCDHYGSGRLAGYKNFNSRTSCEVRLHVSDFCAGAAFQLTHLLRGATLGVTVSGVLKSISTHAPLARCDTGWTKFPAELVDFNSRTSCEVRRTIHSRCIYVITISTHAPLARCDIFGFNRRFRRRISTHAPLARCDLSVVAKLC